MTEPNRPCIEWIGNSTDLEDTSGHAIWTYRSGGLMAEEKTAVPFADFRQAFRVDEVIRAAYWCGRHDERQRIADGVSKVLEGEE